jgi:hypothetical protein
MNNSQFENKENLRQAAKNILNRKGASTESTNKILEQTIFSDYNRRAEIDILKLSSQITMNESLKETLKYLKTKNKEKTNKKAIFGELWNTINSEEDYCGELVDFVVDSSLKNIFVAA